MKRALFGLFLCTICAIPSAVSAHAVLIRSDPAGGQVLMRAPSRVVLWYAQEIENRKSTVKVFDAAGNRVDLGDGGVDLGDADHASMIVTLPALTLGTYFVRWTVVSVEDGDVSEGEFTFLVGEFAISEK